MKSGIELIAEERKEQIEKHGYDSVVDSEYTHDELNRSAMFAITGNGDYWPCDWNTIFRDKIRAKNRVQQLTVAGALIAAEIDRLQNSATSEQTTFNNTDYEYCPCHNCSVQDVPEGELYDCSCDMAGPLLEYCSELCPSVDKCRAVRDVSTHLEEYDNKCPRCKSDTGMKWPRGDQPYCEDCGWPREDFGQ